ncbi:hypothetical protein DFQ11_102577 [Winogradskyella epiphytica]|uniref:Uncharacterized protein n=1 Tax=Winogradskyella epiphytica TaxID=262005 RepID=A0A2V4YET4_9FLAO|nr:hypothetical protein [Winogradskyella epiphytica]PYE81997.1 hypothetical protein DFQ11_102577 [Winogradskyella epiphytica]GGW61222.1 hypothetical protein GCM10008085_10950 [Winogradskyella epiphytica]
MAKKSTLKKTLKIIGGLIVFFTLPSLLFFGFLYLKYDEDIPTGQQGPKADQLATQMLNALNEEAYLNTDYLEWTFKGKHHYKWYKSEHTCEVSWEHFTVILDLKNSKNSKVFVADQEYNGIEKQDYIKKAENYFNNDSFWLVAPYKAFDNGTERRLVKTEDNKEALLVTYKSGGTTPGDSYLWHFDDQGKPKSFQMWVDILPIEGLEATWENWITTESGAELPTFHKFLLFGLELDNIKGLQL